MFWSSKSEIAAIFTINRAPMMPDETAATSKPIPAQYRAEPARRPSLATLTDEEREEELDVVTNRAREKDRANPGTRKTLDDSRHSNMY